MDLKAYFQGTRGMGVLATADAKGPVDAAVYSRPHVLEPGQVAFIMPGKKGPRTIHASWWCFAWTASFP